MTLNATDSAGHDVQTATAQAAILTAAFEDRLPMPRELQDITEHFGVPIAQDVFRLCVESLPRYASLIRRIRSFDARGFSDLQDSAKQFEVTIVRSSLPVRDIEWGTFAECWQTWSRSLGFTTDIIETHEDGDIRLNAGIISDHLISHPHPRRILVTYGQGAAELHWLFKSRFGLRGGPVAHHGQSPELSSIHTWINVAGAFGGAAISRLANDSWWTMLKAKASLYFGRSSFRAQIRRHRELDSRLPAWRAQPNFPSRLQVINVIGQPLASSLPLNLIVSYAALAKMIGPNDGAVGLYDSIAHPGLIVPIQGMNHGVQGFKFEPVFKRLLAIIVQDANASRRSLIHDVGENQRSYNGGV